MRIKTVKYRLDDAEIFDEEVNGALAEGYQLVRQNLVRGFRLDGGNFVHNMLFAELVLPDPVPEPEQPDLLEALHTIRDHCAAMPTERCLTPDCPLSPWCDLYTADGISPMDWVIPEKEADK